MSAPGLNPVTGKSFTVMVVDDSRTFRTYLKTILASASFDPPIECATAEDCVVQLSRANPKPDLVIVDVEMPGSSGIELVNVLRPRYPSMKIICATSRTDEGTISAMKGAGVDAYLTKPINPDLALGAIRDILRT